MESKLEKTWEKFARKVEYWMKTLNTMPLRSGAFVLSNSIRNMNIFIHVTNGFYINDVYYGDTDSLYIKSKNWNKSEKAGLIGESLIQVKKEYRDEVIFYGLFIAPKKILFN